MNEWRKRRRLASINFAKLRQYLDNTYLKKVIFMHISHMNADHRQSGGKKKIFLNKLFFSSSFLLCFVDDSFTGLFLTREKEEFQFFFFSSHFVYIFCVSLKYWIGIEKSWDLYRCGLQEDEKSQTVIRQLIMKVFY